MPFIRYRIEDVGVPSDRRCTCGRGLPLMERVTGRVADYLKRRDGSMVAGVSLVERTLTAIPGLEQLQVVQPSLEDIVLKVVRAPDFSAATEQALLSEFRTVFGPGINIRAEYVARIPQERSGKYRFSICRISDVRRSEEHTSELQPPCNLVCRLLLEKKKTVAHAPFRPA